jgi:hypothetical protein
LADRREPPPTPSRASKDPDVEEGEITAAVVIVHQGRRWDSDLRRGLREAINLGETLPDRIGNFHLGRG